jgi:arsenate reductase-like glutaredoxin family protein
VTGSIGSTIAVLVEHPAAIKRPVIESGANIFIGFDDVVYARRLKP